MTDAIKKNLMILMVDDDEDYYALSKQALSQSSLPAELIWVPDGEECMNYLLRKGEYADLSKSPRPGVILLDMNMPRKNGIETLKEIKSTPHLRTIPVTMLTISRAEEHVLRSYEFGANSFITKPLEFNLLISALKTFVNYWHAVATLPSK